MRENRINIRANDIEQARIVKAAASVNEPPATFVLVAALSRAKVIEDAEYAARKPRKPA